MRPHIGSTCMTGPRYVHHKWNAVNEACAYHLAISFLADTSLRCFPKLQKQYLCPASTYGAAPNHSRSMRIHARQSANTFHTTGPSSLSTAGGDCSGLSSLQNDVDLLYAYACIVHSHLFGHSLES